MIIDNAIFIIYRGLYLLFIKQCCMKILYHGTDKKFRNFNFSFAKPNKDFGKGFYLTSDLKQAIEWANIKNRSNHYVMAYELDEELLKNLSIHELLCYNTEWLDYIVKCRIESFEEKCDLVFDRIADSLRGEEIASLLRRYWIKDVSSEYVLEKIKWGSQNDQWCFKTSKALSVLRLKSVLHSYINAKGKWENKYEYAI